MQLTPRYGSNPIITLDGSQSAILAPVSRQRQRLVDTLSTFTDEQWLHPSRCAGWTNRDVIVHLESTNGFWAFSIAAGLRGEPTTFLATFDPVSSPAQLVAGAKDLTTTDLLGRLAASTSSMLDVLGSLSDSQWSLLAESPPGHVSINAVAHHALWDAWVHERDILLPMGISPVEDADEVAACLRYVASLAPALAVSRGAVDTGTLAVTATQPDVAFVVDVSDHVHVRAGVDTADFRLTGDAVDLVEALSIRSTLAQPVPAHCAWMVSGLAKVFGVDSP